MTDVARSPNAIWIAIATLALGGAITSMAWLSDDAFITFRSVENLMDGQGPVWNAGERAQTFTHPLWFWALAALRVITGECPHSAQWLGIGLSTVAAAILLTFAARARGGATTLLATSLLLLGSHAFVDFATSGLETALAYVLLTALIAVPQTERDRAHRLRRSALLAGLLATTRLDLALLAGPIALANLPGVPRATAVNALLLGALPLAGWSLFAATYYGSPFPVTAFAKAFCHGVPTSELVGQGLRYLGRSLTADPLTLAVLVGGTVAGFARRGERAMAFGVLLYVTYVVEVGGDYMLGRFLVPPFVVAAWLAASAVGELPRSAARAVLAAIVGLAAISPPTWSRAWPKTQPVLEIPPDGIVDEQHTGWFRYGLFSPAPETPTPGMIGQLLAAHGFSRRGVMLGAAVGATGYVVGESIHIVDPWLCDPYLMRLPLGEPNHWRIGHFYRRIPDGLLESVATGENLIADPGFASYYATMHSIIRDPFWSVGRWRNLWRLWTGADRAALAQFATEEYRSPPRRELPFEHFTGDLQAGTQWFAAPQVRCAQGGGLSVTMAEPTTASALVLTATGDTDYILTFRRAGATVGTAWITRRTMPLEGMQPLATAVPAACVPFDGIWIDAVSSVEVPAVGAIGRIELRR